MNRRSSILFPLAFLAILLLLSGCGGKKESERNGNNSGVVSVSTAKATVGQIEDLTTISGKLEALESANIVPKMPGKVALITVDLGSQIKAGDVLMRLEADELAAAVSQAEAALASAQASFEVSRVNYERGRRLLEQGAISQSDFDSKFELAYKTGAQQVAQARAALNMANANYSNTVVTAPFSGVVTAKNANVGEFVSTSSPVITLVNLDKVFVQANVNEYWINQLKEGQKVKVKVTAALDTLFEGTITNIALAANTSTKAFPVKVQIDNAGHVLKPGMFAEVQLSKGSTNALTVPREAVLGNEGQKYVWVVENQRALKREVQTGGSDGKVVSILSGLREGDEVILSGQESIEEGVQVYVR